MKRKFEAARSDVNTLQHGKIVQNKTSIHKVQRIVLHYCLSELDDLELGQVLM